MDTLDKGGVPVLYSKKRRGPVVGEGEQAGKPPPPPRLAEARRRHCPRAYGGSLVERVGVCMHNNSSASARLAAAVFFRAFLDAVNRSSTPRAARHRNDALCWLKDFGYDFLVISGVPPRYAHELMAWVWCVVAPSNNMGPQNERSFRTYRLEG